MWEIDLTSKKSREIFLPLVDKNKIKEVEKAVSQHIQDNFSFVVFEVNYLKKRLELESKIISALSLCEECSPSSKWLGNFSPKEKIRESGLWLVNELHKIPLEKNEFQELKDSLKIT